MSADVLKGLRVVESSAFVAAPSAGMTLAQLGAEVIRIDQIGGGLDHLRWPVTAEGHSIYWASLNKGKRSVTLDLSSPQGREIATALITAPGKGAGLFLTNFPGRGWMAYDTLKGGRSDLIMVEITGNRDGSTAVDYTVNAAIGFPAVTGPAGEGPPTNHVLPAWDVICGQHAVTSMLVAERHRSATGQGQCVQIALSDVALATVSMLGYLGEVEVNGQDRLRLGNDMYGAFGRDFATADGRRVMVVAISYRQWERLLEATETTQQMQQLEALLGYDFTSETDRYLARAAISALIEPWVATRDLDQVRRVFDERGVCWGPFQTFRQLVDEDARCTTSNPLLDDVTQRGIGTYLSAGHPTEFSAIRRRPARPAPQLGQDTDAVLTERLGLTAAEMGRLFDAGIAAGTDHQEG